MANFRFQAWDVTGNRRSGLKQASSRTEVLNWLVSENLTPVSVDQVISGKTRERTLKIKHVSAGDLSGFCWQLATMIDGGLSVNMAIQTIAEDMNNRYFGKILIQIADDMQKGESLSECTLKYPRVFSTMFYSMILAGESGGVLVTTLQRLATFYENRDRLIRKVRGALSYPIFVVCFILVVLTVIMTLIIPRFQLIFKQMSSKGQLPAFTRGFMAIYDVIMHNALYGLILLALGLIVLSVYNKTSKGHAAISRFILAIPFVGKVLTQSFLVIFSRTLSTLLFAGVSILDSLGILSNMTRNDVIKSAVLKTKENIIEGSRVSMGLASSGFFPNVLVKMTQVGEESGSLPEVLDKTAEYYEKRLDGMINTVTRLMEPILIIIVGIIVLVVAIALYLPIFTISDIKT